MESALLSNNEEIKKKIWELITSNINIRGALGTISLLCSACIYVTVYRDTELSVFTVVCYTLSVVLAICHAIVILSVKSAKRKKVLEGIELIALALWGYFILRVHPELFGPAESLLLLGTLIVFSILNLAFKKKIGRYAFELTLLVFAVVTCGIIDLGWRIIVVAIIIGYKCYKELRKKAEIKTWQDYYELLAKSMFIPGWVIFYLLWGLNAGCFFYYSGQDGVLAEGTIQAFLFSGSLLTILAIDQVVMLSEQLKENLPSVFREKDESYRLGVAWLAERKIEKCDDKENDISNGWLSAKGNFQVKFYLLPIVSLIYMLTRQSYTTWYITAIYTAIMLFYDKMIMSSYEIDDCVKSRIVLGIILLVCSVYVMLNIYMFKLPIVLFGVISEILIILFCVYKKMDTKRISCICMAYALSYLYLFIAAGSLFIGFYIFMLWKKKEFINKCFANITSYKFKDYCDYVTGMGFIWFYSYAMGDFGLQCLLKRMNIARADLNFLAMFCVAMAFIFDAEIGLYWVQEKENEIKKKQEVIVNG